MDPAGEASAEQTYRYGVFISYRHDARDRRWATWLHRELEGWRTPRRLVEAGAPPRVGRVFRDEEELSAAPHLSEAIEAALREARYLVVVCSPRTPDSSWVENEIARFRELGRGDRILALLTEGEPHEAFPVALRTIRPGVLPDASGAPRPLDDEPLAADVRAPPGERPRGSRRFALLRLLAPILGCRFDDLRQREQERRTRRLAIAGVASLLLAGAMGVLAAYALQQEGVAKAERAEAQTQRAVALKQREAADRAREEEAAARNRSEDLTEYMLFGLRDQLEPVGRTALLRGVAERVVEYYESRDFAAMTADERRRYGAALVNLGSALEDDAHLEQAMALHERALAIDRRLHEEQPENLLFLDDVAVDQLRIAVCLEAMGRLSDAERSYRAVLDTRRSLVAAHPAHEPYRLKLALTVRNLGDVIDTVGRREEATALYREDHDLLAGVAPSPERDQALAASESRLAEVEAGSNVAGALLRCRRALDARRRFQREDPQNRLLRRDVLRSHIQLARLLLETGSVDASLAEFASLVRGAEDWATEDPKDVWAQAALVECQTRMAVCELQRGRLAAVGDLLSEAVPRGRALVALEPARFQFAQELVAGLGLWAVASGLAGDASAAARFAGEALARIDSLPQESATIRSARVLVRAILVQTRLASDSVTAKDVVAMREAVADGARLAKVDGSPLAEFTRLYSVVVLAGALSSTNRAGEVAAACEEALPVAEAKVRADPDSMIGRYLAGMLHWLAGDARLDTKDPTAALPHLRSAVRHARPSAVPLGEESPILTMIVGSVEQLRGRAESSLGNAPAALEAYRASRAEFEALERAGFMPEAVANTLEDLWDAEAEILLKGGDKQGALAAYRGALAASGRRSELVPKDLDARINVAISHIVIGDILRGLERTAEARASYEAALPLLDAALAAGGGDVDDWDRSRRWHGIAAELSAGMHDPAAESEHRRAAGYARGEWLRRLPPEQRAKLLRGDGDLAGALAAYREALAAKRALAEGSPDDPKAKVALAAAHDSLAEVLAAKADVPAALAERRAALEIRRALAAADPTDGARGRAEAQSHLAIGRLLEGGGDSAGALEHYRRCVERTRTLAERDPDGVALQRDLVVVHEKIGMTLEAQKDLPGALLAYGEGLRTAQRLAESRPSESEWPRDVGILENRLGDVSKAQGDLSAARGHHRAAVATHTRLADAAPTQVQAQVDAAIAHEKLRSAATAQGDFVEAVAAQRAAVAFRRRLTEIEPKSAARAADLSLSHEILAFLLQQGGDLDGALEAGRAALAVSRTWSRAAPEDPDWLRRLGSQNERMGILLIAKEDVAGALEHLHAGLEALRPHVERHPALARVVQSLVARVQKAEEAGRAKDLLEGKASPAGPSDHRAMAYLLYRRKRYRESAEHFEQSLSDPTLRADVAGGDLYDAACSATLASAEGGAGADALRARAFEWLTEDVRRRRDRLAQVEAGLAAESDAAKKAALESERRGLLDHLTHARVRDPDLASLRALPEFRALFPESEPR